MIRDLLLWLAIRRLRGRTVGLVLRTEPGMVAVLDARPGLAGVRGRDLDGGSVLVPWSEAVKVMWGPKVDVATESARRRHADMEGLLGTSAVDRHEPKPALSPEEIEAELRAFRKQSAAEADVLPEEG